MARETVINDDSAPLTFVYRRPSGGIHLGQGRNGVNLSPTEVARLVEYIAATPQ